jgi:hypothetical protein
VIDDKFVDLYARNSGLRDKLVAERDVVLPYALRGLFDAGVMNHLAFQARDPFDPGAFFERIRGGDYDWADIERLIRSSERIEPYEIISTVEPRFGFLRQLTELEQQVIADAKSGWNEPLSERLRAEIRHRFLHGQ